MTAELTVIDAEVIAPLDTAAAQRLDTRIRLLAGQINDTLTKLHDLVEQAKRGEIHKALGFPSWTAYVADALTVQARLDRGQRRELVGYLAGEGMSQRVIADVVGADRKTVRSDLAQLGEIGPPEPNAEAEQLVALGYAADDQEAADMVAMADVTDEQFEDVLVEARAQGDLPRENVVNLCDERAKKVTGRDGKTYPAKPPQPQRDKPRRGPITDSFWRATFDLGRVVARVGRLADDDRLDRNLDTIAGTNLRDLVRARDELNRVISRLGGDLP